MSLHHPVCSSRALRSNPINSIHYIHVIHQIHLHKANILCAGVHRARPGVRAVRGHALDGDVHARPGRGAGVCRRGPRQVPGQAARVQLLAVLQLEEPPGRRHDRRVPGARCGPWRAAAGPAVSLACWQAGRAPSDGQALVGLLISATGAGPARLDLQPSKSKFRCCRDGPCLLRVTPLRPAPWMAISRAAEPGEGRAVADAAARGRRRAWARWATNFSSSRWPASTA
jgi:hypothetical protein